MKSVKISVFACLVFFGLSFMSGVYAAPIGTSAAYFQNPDTFKFNTNRFRFKAAVDPDDGYVTGTWNIQADLKALDKGDLTTSNVTGYYLEENIDTGDIQKVKFEAAFTGFTLQLIGWISDGDNDDDGDDDGDDDEEEALALYHFEGTFSPIDLSGVTARDADLWTIYGEFTSMQKNTFKDFDAWVGYTNPDQGNGGNAPVPEPASLLLVGTGMICIAIVRNRPRT